jgi:hypothetical protein
MKERILFFIVFAAISFQTFANMQTTGWRWRNDDGDLKTATWATTDDRVPVTITKDQTIRLRVRYDNPFGDADQNFTTTGLVYATKEAVHLQYENNPESPNYTGNEDFDISGANAVFTSVGPDAFFDFATTANVTDGSETESAGIVFNSLNTGDMQSAWTAGKFMSTSQSVVVAHNTYTEVEYAIKPTEHCESGTYYFFGGGSDNIIHPGTTKLETFPELTIDLSSAVINKTAPEIKVSTGADRIRVFALPQGKVNVSLYNAVGNLVRVLVADGAEGAVDIRTSGLAKGLYILNVQSTEGKAQKKVMVN